MLSTQPISLTFFQLFLCFLSLFHLTNAATHNEACGVNQANHCDVNVSLVCSPGTNTCQCANGTLTDSVFYDLDWDPSQRSCAGKVRSACVGTRQHAVPTGWKSIPCMEEFTCIQLRDMPLGVGSCQNVPKVHSHGNSCDQKAYCDSSRGLVCTEGRCSCSKERVQTSPAYTLTWDRDMNNCVAPIGATCIGTKQSPLAPGHKSILCVLEADCVEVAGKTPGVGICQSRSHTSASGLLNPTFQFLTTVITGMMMVVVRSF